MDTRFQVLFHSPLRGAFHLSLTVLLRYRSPGVFSLGGWSPLIPPGFLVSRGTWDHSPRSLSAFAYRAFTFSGPPSQVVRLTDWFFTPRRVGSHARLCPTTPTWQRLPASTPRGFGLLPFRSPLLRESRLISPPPATEMFHFAGLPSIPYFIQVWMMCFRTSGFPIRRSWALSGAGPLPRLFAACHVLLRLQVPRHPPCARSIFSLTLYLGLLLACLRMGVWWRRRDLNP